MNNIEHCKLLERSLQLAVNAHYGQVDKAGMPYIFHPLRVMQNCTEYDEKIVAVLHDVLEDTNTTVQALKDLKLPYYIIEAIVALTKKDFESYEDFIKRVSTNKIATQVKKHDLLDNMDLNRLCYIDENAKNRLLKYKEAFAFLSTIEF